MAFLRLASGTASPTGLLLTGKLKLRGGLVLALALPTALQDPQTPPAKAVGQALSLQRSTSVAAIAPSHSTSSSCPADGWLLLARYAEAGHRVRARRRGRQVPCLRSPRRPSETPGRSSRLRSVPSRLRDRLRPRCARRRVDGSAMTQQNPTTNMAICGDFSAPGRIRTCDLRIRSPRPILPVCRRSARHGTELGAWRSMREPANGLALASIVAMPDAPSPAIPMPEPRTPKPLQARRPGATAQRLQTANPVPAPVIEPTAVSADTRRAMRPTLMSRRGRHLRFSSGWQAFTNST